MNERRKELTRQYKEAIKPSGVYRVHNTRNGKSLVGAARDVRARLNRHRAELRLGIHANAALLRDWQALGEAAFAFETLDTLEPDKRPNYDPTDDLQVLEALWLEKLAPYEPAGYNQPGKRV